MSHDRLTWRELLPGTLIALVLAAVVYATLRYAQVGALRGDKITLHAPVNAARGVMKGSEVWIAGRRAGKVKEIAFRPVGTDTGLRVLVVLEVPEKFRDQLRTDSYAQIRTGASLIGAPVVHLSVGSPGARMLADGDTLQTRRQSDFEGISSQASLAARHLPEIMGNVRLLSTQLEGAAGTVGALLDEGGTQQLSVAGARAGAVARSLTAGSGTVGLTFRRREPIARAQAVMAATDSLRTLLTSGGGVYGRFRSDSTLLATMTSLRNEISIVKALLDESRGTAGRVLHDQALWDELARLERELAATMADVRRRPLRYIHF